MILLFLLTYCLVSGIRAGCAITTKHDHVWYHKTAKSFHLAADLAALAATLAALKSFNNDFFWNLLILMVQYQSASFITLATGFAAASSFSRLCTKAKME